MATSAYRRSTGRCCTNVRSLSSRCVCSCSRPPAVALAQAPGAGNDAVFRYRGADRDARLVERAKQEGSVVLYTSLAPTESKPLAEAFQKKYGIKVVLWRGAVGPGGAAHDHRGAGRRHAVDVIETNGPEMEMLAREKLLGEIHSPYLADLPAGAIPAHRTWFPDRFNFYVVGFNTTKVQRSRDPGHLRRIPRSEVEGAHRASRRPTPSGWRRSSRRGATPKGWNTSGSSRRCGRMSARGHMLLAKLVVAGEVPVGLTIYNSNIVPLKRKGAPIDFVPVQPVVARPQGIGVARNAPHPHAALLFTDFVLSPEGQRLFESLGRVPASTRVKSELNNFPFIAIDPATALDEKDKWEKLWNDLFLKQ